MPNNIREHLGEALRVARCFAELGYMALQDVVMAVDEAQDCYGPDSAEDAAIRPSVGHREPVA